MISWSDFCLNTEVQYSFRQIPTLSYVLFVCIWICTASMTLAQQYVGDHPRFEVVALALDELALEQQSLERSIDISITGSLTQFAVVFSRETGVNLTVDPRLTQQVVANFKETNPKEILLHLARFYDLDIELNGSIISLVPHDQPILEYAPREPDIVFDERQNLVSFDLRGDTLDYVVKAITRLTKSNVTATQLAGQITVEGFARSLPLEAALEQLATRNSLIVTFDEAGRFYVIDAAPSSQNGTAGHHNNARRAILREREPETSSDLVYVLEDSLGRKRYSVNADQTPLADVLTELSRQSGANYLLLEPSTPEVDFHIRDQPFETLLQHLLSVNGFAYRKESDVYLIGSGDRELLNETQLIKVMHRSVRGLSEGLPSELTERLEVQEFLQINSLVVAGPAESIAELEEFVDAIDQRVPVVTIELLIVDVQRTTELGTGIEIGTGSEPVIPRGGVFPGVDLTLSAKSINELLSLLSGNGIINLGQVTPNFYARVRAAESNGFARVHSRPRLSTINGQEATLTIGETRYYQVQRTTLAGNLNPVTLQDVNFESVNADFTIRILPMVAGDGSVTLEIEVDQSDFIGRLQANAPPAQVSRTFSSMIRMSDGEMIVLGGLESKGVSDAGRGVPFLSRVPIIRHLFSTRQRSREKSKLLVFVRPRIVY